MIASGEMEWISDTEDLARRRSTPVFAHLPGMAYRCRNDVALTMEVVSHGCIALTGYRESDLVDNARVAFMELIHPADRERVRTEMTKAIRAARPYRLIYRIRTARAQEKWVWDRGQRVVDARHRVIALEGFVEDVTDEMLVEHRLQAREAILNESQRIANVGSWEVDLRTGVCSATDEFWRIVGREPNDQAATIEAYYGMVHPDDRAAVEERLVQVVTEAGSASYDHRVVLPDGSIRHVNGRAKVLCDHGGVLSHVIGTIQDITDRKRDETFLHAFFESPATHSCVFEIDDANDDWIFVLPNGPFARSYGYAAAEMAGKTARHVGIPEDRFQFFMSILRQCRDSGERVSVEISPSKTVDRLWRLGNIAPFTLNGRTLLAYVATDITERKALEQQVIQAQKMEAVAVLAGGIAHDFNNLITVISGSAQLILDERDSDDPRNESVLDIKQAADRAGALTRQLLAFSRRQPFRPQLVDVNEVVHQTERMLHRLIGDEHALNISLSAMTPFAHIDAGQLEQLLVNLVMNARDAMPDGGTIEVATNVLTPGSRTPEPDLDGVCDECIEISVRDSGVGMDEELKARIFEPFFTTKDVGKGTGLGLATVFTIVKASSGRVSVDSTPGVGTTFTVSLPHAILGGVPSPDDFEHSEGCLNKSHLPSDETSA